MIDALNCFHAVFFSKQYSPIDLMQKVSCKVAGVPIYDPKDELKEEKEETKIGKQGKNDALVPSLE